VRFLADKNISYRLCAVLDNAGHEAAHVDQFSLGAAEDAAILDFARSGEWVVVSSDTDFGTLLAAQRATTPSVQGGRIRQNGETGPTPAPSG
jgi:predicted nuclease of predicted toxin-antitoxin system